MQGALCVRDSKTAEDASGKTIVSTFHQILPD
jgi:hypothetical protein